MATGSGGVGLPTDPNAIPNPRPPAPPKPAQEGPMRILSEGMLMRLAPIANVTPTSVLNRKIWMPVVLNTFTVTEDALHSEYDTLSAGQFSQGAMGGGNARRLRDLTSDTLTIDFDVPWLVASGQDPYHLRATIYEILRSRKAVHMVVTFTPNPDPHAELDMYCTLRSISKEVRPAERDTRYMTIAYKEWRDASVKRRSATAKSGPTSSRKPGWPLPANHPLKEGDTLLSLSYEFYGRYDFWRHIRDANGIPKKFGMGTPVVNLPGHFKVGAILKIPFVPESSGGAPI